MLTWIELCKSCHTSCISTCPNSTNSDKSYITLEDHCNNIRPKRADGNIRYSSSYLSYPFNSSYHGMPPNHDIPFSHLCPNDSYDSYSSIPPNQFFPTPQLLHAKILFVHKPHTHRHLCMQAP
ncbi:hypothetical protein EYC84_008572 [Monilinia fructicola]|nr:hypothetical protein EYC84_008572 [Monilinia fructicola]